MGIRPSLTSASRAVGARRAAAFPAPRALPSRTFLDSGPDARLHPSGPAAARGHRLNLYALGPPQATPTRPDAGSRGSALQLSRVKEWMPSDRYPPPILQHLGPEAVEVLRGKVAEASAKAQEILAETHIAKWFVNAWYQQLMEGEITAETAFAEMRGKGVSEGHADHYITVVLKKRQGTGRVSPSTPGGYLIEDIATHDLPDSNTQQGTRMRNTRPDIVWPLGQVAGQDVSALMDITADSKAGYGHILKKGNGTWLRHNEFPYAAEILYDPLQTGGTNIAPLSPEEEQRLEEIHQARTWHLTELRLLRKETLQSNYERILVRLPQPQTLRHKIHLSLANAEIEWNDGQWTAPKLNQLAAEYDNEDPDTARLANVNDSLDFVAGEIGCELEDLPTFADVEIPEPMAVEENS